MKSPWLLAPLRLLVSLCFTTALLVVVLLGLYASLGRLYMPQLAGQRAVIQAYLAENVPFPLQFDAVEGDWQQLSPIIVLRGLRADVPVKGTVWHFSSRDVAVELDVIRSLIRQQPVLRDIRIDGGAVTMSGPPLAFPARAADDAGPPPAPLSEVLASVFNLGVVRMSDSRLEMNLPGVEQPLVLVLTLQLEHRGSFRRLRADIALGEQQPGRIGLLLEATQSLAGALDTIDAHVHWDRVPLNHWLQGMAWEGRVPRITEAFSGQAWGRWVPGADIRLHGRVAAPLIAWQRNGEAWPALEDFSAEFLLERTPDLHWRLQLPALQFTCQGVASPVQALSAEYRPGAPLRLSVPRLDLPAARRLLGVLRPGTDSPGSVLATLDPQGVLAPLVLDVGRGADGNRHWQLRAGLQQVAVSSWKGAPAASGVDGYLEAGPHGGFVDLDSRAFSMAFPTVYEKPMQFTAARARVGWQLDAERVTVASSRITLHSPEGNAQGLLSLDLPKRHDADHASWMSLVIGLTDAPAAARNKYIPKTLSPGLKRWLDASIGPGQVRRGGFIFDGPLEAHARGPVVQLFLDVEDTALRFDPRWPALQGIDGRLLVDDGDVTVWAQRARLFGSRAQPVLVRVGHDGEGPLLLAVQGSLAGPTQDVIRLLQESPLRKAVGDTFTNWGVTGDFSGQLDLLVPLEGTAPAQVAVDARVDGNRLRLGGQGLQFEAVSGPLQFRTDSGLQSAGLTASLWGEPLALRIDSQAVPESSRTRLQAQGKVRLQSLKDWLGWSWLHFADGAAAVDAEINLGAGLVPALQLRSDLKGVTVGLPPPYRKEAATAWPFRADLPLGGESAMMDFAVGPDLRVAALREDGALRVALALGNVPFRAPQQAGVTVYGRLPQFDWAQWQPPLQRLVDGFAGATATGPQAATPAAFRVSGLYADTVRIFGQEYAGLVASVRQDEQRWWVGVRSEKLSGRIGLPQASGEPFLVQLDRLVLPADTLGSRQAAADGAAAADPLQDLDWRGWPLLQVDIRRLLLGSQDFGRWQFAVLPSDGRLRIERLQANASLLRIDADGGGAWLDWLRHPDGRQETRLHASVLVRDVDAVLEALGYDPGLTAREAVMAFDLHWPDAPLSARTGQVAGRSGFHFSDGYLKTGNTAQTGVLKVLSVFNLDTILRRIRLDFSDLYQEGLAFDDCKAELALQDGWITITEPLVIRGPASHFVLEGRVDMVNDVLDNRLTVTLPVSNSLPWLAAIAGGLPAAVGVYVASKVLEKQVNSFTSLVYEVSGSRNDPQVRFQRLFDAQGLIPKMPAFLVPKPRPAAQPPATDAAPATAPVEVP